MKHIKMVNKTHPYFECGRCKKKSIKKSKSKKEIGELAYGSRNSNKAKKEKWLENE